MVAGDHPHVDAGGERRAHRIFGLAAKRVDDADEGDEDEIAHRRHRLLDRPRHRVPVEVAGGEGEHAQALLGQLLVGGQDLVPGLGDRDLTALPERRAAESQDDVRRALDRHEVRLRQDPTADPFRPVVEGRHELVGGVEWHLRAPFDRTPRPLRIGAHLRGEHHQRRLGGIAHHRSVTVDGGIAAERQAQREPFEVGRLGAGDAENRA